MLHGCIPALVTPMLDNGDLCLKSLKKLVKWHENAGIRALVLLGSTGEGTSITASERDDLIETAVQAADKCQIWVGATAPSTRKAQQYVLRAKALGAHGALVAAPPYVRPTEKGLQMHFEAIASLGLPILLYNHPARTATDITPEFVFKLMDNPGIVGIKEAFDVTRIARYHERQFPAFCGDDPLFKEALSYGASGSISVIANAVPKLVANYFTTRQERDWQKLMKFQRDLGCQSNPIPIKYLLHKMGMIPNGLRLPLHPLEAQYTEKFNQILEEVQHESHDFA